MTTLNTRRLCAKLDVSKTTALRWVSMGCPCIKTKNGGYNFILKEVETWRDANIQPSTESDPDFLKARARKEQALAEKHELDLRVRIGSLIDRKAADRAFFNCGRQIRDALMNLPDRLAGVLAAEANQVVIHTLLTKEFRLVLTSVATALPLEKGQSRDTR